MRTTAREIQNHIDFIERHSDYRIHEGNTYYIGDKECYTVTLDGESKAVIISNNKSDILDMLEPFWKVAFENDCRERGI